MSEKNQSSCLTPLQRELLLKHLKSDLPRKYYRRIKIMLLADEGQSRKQICEALGCSQETARYWIFMAHIGQVDQWKHSYGGRPKVINEEYLERLQELVKQSPKNFGYPFRRWTGHKLSKHLLQEFRIKLSDRHINRLLKQMGLSTREKFTQTEQSINIDRVKKKL